LDTLYGHLSNLSQETAMILPEGYELEFVVPSGSPEVFKNLIEYIDKEISLVICGENEAGQAEAGSRASSQVANTVRVVRASELSEMLSHTLTQTLVRWIVDLNFGVDVAAPVLTREFRIEESPLTMPDVSLLIQSGYTPRKEWIERHFRVELEEKQEGEGEDQTTTYDPQQDQDLFGSIFGADGQQAGQPSQQQEQAAAQDLNAAANVMDMPGGAAPEESQADAMGAPSAEEQLGGAASDATAKAAPDSEQWMTDEEIDKLLGGMEDEEEGEGKKPFGNQIITEDEAVEMDRK
jgi:phage gp29-like protein